MSHRGSSPAKSRKSIMTASAGTTSCVLCARCAKLPSWSRRRSARRALPAEPPRIALALALALLPRMGAGDAVVGEPHQGVIEGAGEPLQRVGGAVDRGPVAERLR